MFLVRKDVVSLWMMGIELIPLPLLQLITAAGDKLTMEDHIKTTVSIQCQSVTHCFIVVKTLIVPVILGNDFLWQHKLTPNFASIPIKIASPPISTQITDIDPIV